MNTKKRVVDILKEKISPFLKSIFDFFRKFRILLSKMLMQNNASHTA